MEEKNILRNQKGFTLIEIIAVLIILGILAAVAVPKFLNLQTDAQTKAVEGALAAGASSATLNWSQYLLRTDGIVPTGLSAAFAWTPAATPAVDPIETVLGDFTASYSYVSATGVVTVTIATGPSWFASSSAVKVKTFVISTP